MVFQLTTFIFLILALLIFHLCPGKLRKYVLLAASVFFVYWQGKAFGLIVLLGITALSFILGLFVTGLQNKNRDGAARAVSTVGITALAAVLFGWKYLTFVAGHLGITVPERITLLGLPIGLSFYTFQGISYLADLMQGKSKAQKNPFVYALYMMWFPKWMSGPIERADSLIEEIEKTASVRLFDFDRTIRALSYLLWGLFMKLVIADRVGIPVDMVFEEPSSYGALTLLIASLLYTMQIYCDFAGYTNMMIGISAMFGMELTQNFRTPYLAENIVEFWRGWHISLSNFLKDYIYIPLGGNRKGTFRKAVNTMVVFLVCGMWHGAGFTFIAWGILHGVLNVLSGMLKNSRVAFLVKGMSGRIISFLLVSFAWIFFRASSMGTAIRFIIGMIPFAGSTAFSEGLSFQEKTMLGLSSIEWWVACLSLAFLTLMDVIAYRKKSIPPEVVTTKWGDIRRCSLFVFLALVILIFGRYGAGEEIRNFVYAQF